MAEIIFVTVSDETIWSAARRLEERKDQPMTTRPTITLPCVVCGKLCEDLTPDVERVWCEDHSAGSGYVDVDYREI